MFCRPVTIFCESLHFCNYIQLNMLWSLGFLVRSSYLNLSWLCIMQLSFLASLKWKNITRLSILSGFVYSVGTVATLFAMVCLCFFAVSFRIKILARFVIIMKLLDDIGIMYRFVAVIIYWFDLYFKNVLLCCSKVEKYPCQKKLIYNNLVDWCYTFIQTSLN